MAPQSDQGRDALTRHGGNLAAAARLYPDAPRPFIDLSTGINPLPYPVGEISAAAWSRLPDADAEAALIAAAVSAYGAAGADEVVAAPGTQALIQLLPRLVPARRVAVMGPTYNEHAGVWRACGAEVAEIRAVEAMAGADVGVIVNPNNPDGRVVSRVDLEALAADFHRRGGLLVVDEAFADLEDGVSLVPNGIPAGCLVLRSFGKTYGLAGIRLGFALGDVGLIARIRAMLGPWAVSGPALEIGARALMDRGWLERTKRAREVDCVRLDGMLTRAGMTVVGGTRLFRLASVTDSQALVERLGRAGIVVRPFDYAPEWIRLGIPAGDGWVRFERGLT